MDARQSHRTAEGSTRKDRRRARSALAHLAASDRELADLDTYRVEGLHGESFTARDAEDRAEELEDRIRLDLDDGVRTHTPVNRGQRLLGRWAPFADLLVFVYFLAVVFNVDWADPRRTPVQAVLAVVLATIATAGVAWTLRFVAAYFRQNKPDHNRFLWRARTRQRGLDPMRLMLVLILGGVGVMMGYRIFTDARASAMGVASSALVAGFFALVAVALNYVIFLVEFSDGSPVTDELRHLRAQLEPVQHRRETVQRTRRELHQRLDLWRLESQDDASSGPPLTFPSQEKASVRD